jgi:hypothetical protein
MRRDIGDPLAVEQYRASIAQAAHVLISCPSHTQGFISQSPRAIKFHHDRGAARDQTLVGIGG